MGLLSFLGIALPWLTRGFLSKGTNSGLLSQFAGLAQEMTDIKNPLAYEKLLNDSQLLLQFQQKAFVMQQEYMKAVCQDRMHARKRDVWLFNKAGKNYRADKMIYIACAGLVGCLAVLGICRSALSGELVSILSAAIGVFGSCLKDAYVFEFGQGRVQSFGSGFLQSNYNGNYSGNYQNGFGIGNDNQATFPGESNGGDF